MPNLYNYSPISKVVIKKRKMEINYIILAHKNPQQVQRLIDRLTSPDSHFYIHIDKGAEIIPFTDVLSNNPNILFVPDEFREYGTWGDLGIVKATIAALSQIVENKRNGYCVLLSGQDYPLQNNQSIHNFFKINYGINFIETFPLPHRDGWGIDGGFNRLTQYKINLSNTRRDFIQLPTLFEKAFYSKPTIHKLLKLLEKKHYSAFLKIFKKRQIPNHLKPYGGGQWWAFPIETVKIILTFIDSNPKYIRYHENTLLPDEIFFHSILMHLKETKDSLIVKPSITYVNWERKNTPLPVLFTKEDYKELKKESEYKLFARKFDTEIDEQILDCIDRELLN